MYNDLAKEFLDISVKKCKSKSNIDNFASYFSIGEAGIIAYLAFNSNNVTPGELSEKFNLSTARIASILNSLEHKKLVKRKVSSSDKRKVLVSIDENIKNKTIEKRNAALNKISTILELMGEHDAKELIRLMKKVYEISENMDFGGDFFEQLPKKDI